MANPSIFCGLLLLFLAPVDLSAWVVGQLPFRARLCRQRETSTTTACPMVFGDWFKFPDQGKKDDDKSTKKPAEAKKEEEKQEPTPAPVETPSSASAVTEEPKPEPPTPAPTKAADVPKAAAVPVAAQAATSTIALKEGEVLQGICRSFNSRKGFGFVDAVDANNSVMNDDKGGFFVHQSAIEMDGFRKLKIGQKVSFVVEMDKEGRYRAVNVKPETVSTE
ncbi:hypothetical protein ACA910_021073 [Epithemia clementina (nom. ined.)]